MRVTQAVFTAEDEAVRALCFQAHESDQEILRVLRETPAPVKCK